MLSMCELYNQHTPNNQDGMILGELVLLAAGLEVNLATNSIMQVDLASN